MKKTKYFGILFLLVMVFMLTACKNNNENVKKKAGDLLSLKLEEISGKSKINPNFDKEIFDYEYKVQSDIYGVRFTMEIPKDSELTIDGDKAEEVEEKKSKDKNKEESTTKKFSKIIELSQEIEDYGKEIKKVVEIEIDKSKKYTVNIVRENLQKLYDKFKVESFNDPVTGIQMDYQLYVPENYDKSKKYPLIVALHGSGQAKQSIDMVLKRYEMCTTWLKNGYEDVIIFAPHGRDAKNPDKPLETIWSTQKNDKEYGPGIGGQVAYRIIEELRKKYSIDINRQYLTGVSLGGQGAYTYIAKYPKDWAGVLISCATAWDNDDAVAKNIKEYEIPIWIYHAPDDPVRPFTEFNDMVDALNRYDAKYRVTSFNNKEIFFPSAHFTWVPMYSNTDALEWLMNQSK